MELHFPTVRLAGWWQAEVDAGKSAAGTDELKDGAILFISVDNKEAKKKDRP